MMRIAICDDQKSERETLKHFLKQYFSKTDYACQIDEYAGGEALVADYEEDGGNWELVFLDIFMKGMDGMQAARAIRKMDAQVPLVFLTSTPDYALEGYDVRAIGYLMKPLAVERASALLRNFLQQEYSGPQQTLLVREGARGARISYREILYVESRNTTLRVHTLNGQEHRIYRKLDEVEQELAGRTFLRCHQSFLVNLAHVRAAERDHFVMSTGEPIPLRQRDAKKLRDAYFSYLFQQAEITKR